MPEHESAHPAKFDFGSIVGSAGQTAGGATEGVRIIDGPTQPIVTTPSPTQTGTAEGPGPFDHFAMDECRKVKDDLYECDGDGAGTDKRYYDENGEGVGSRAGVGGGRQENGRTTTEGPELEAEVGHYVDKEGRESLGIDVHGNTLKNKTVYGDDKTRFEFEFGGPDGKMVAEGNEDTAEIGAQASGSSGSGTLSTHGTDHDSSVRVGVSAGPGGAGRVHYGDDDEDGVREYGVGFDVGPLSVDVKSEDAVGGLLGLSSPALAAARALFSGYAD